MDKVTPWLWCDRNAEEVAEFYTSAIPNSRIVEVVRSPADYPNGKADDVLTVEFTLAGRSMVALNGGPNFRFTEAISLQIECENQAEVDRYWDLLSAHPESEQCGWVKDCFGLFWQIVPKQLNKLLADPDRARAKRVMEKMMGMKKLEIDALEAA